VVPTILVVSVGGGLFQRGWWLIPIAAVAWPVLLIAGDVIDPGLAVLGAAAVGVLNASFGVIVGRMTRAIFRRPSADHPVTAL
jgi:hypothetical protein